MIINHYFFLYALKSPEINDLNYVNDVNAYFPANEKNAQIT